eukprot:5532000-Prymnesium_polylepis.4
MLALEKPLSAAVIRASASRMYSCPLKEYTSLIEWVPWGYSRRARGVDPRVWGSRPTESFKSTSFSVSNLMREATAAGLAPGPSRHFIMSRSTFSDWTSGREKGSWTILSKYSQPEMCAFSITLPNVCSIDATTTRESIARKARIGAPGTERINCIASSTFTLRPSRQRSRSSTTVAEGIAQSMVFSRGLSGSRSRSRKARRRAHGTMYNFTPVSLSNIWRKSNSSFSSAFTWLINPRLSLMPRASWKIFIPLFPLSWLLLLDREAAGITASTAPTALPMYAV